MQGNNWLRFAWDLNSLPSRPVKLPEHYAISEAASEDDAELRKVIATAFTLDGAWNPSLQEVMQIVNAWLDRAFDTESSTVLALRHGTRIIGAATLLLSPDEETHLAPGPCILLEYRNRGFGTQLLARALELLRERGLVQAIALAKENTAASKFLYTKFNSASSPAESTPLLAA